jgi:voltage-gated potassium channel
MLRPVVVSVLDAMLRDPSDVRVEEVPVGARLAGQSLLQIKLQERVGVIVFAIRRADGQHVFNPAPDYRLDAGDFLIACASPEQLGAARRVLAEG